MYLHLQHPASFPSSAFFLFLSLMYLMPASISSNPPACGRTSRKSGNGTNKNPATQRLGHSVENSQCHASRRYFSGHRRAARRAVLLIWVCIVFSNHAAAESYTIVLSKRNIATWMTLRTKQIGMDILVTWVRFFIRVECNSGWHDPTWENISYIALEDSVVA